MKTVPILLPLAVLAAALCLIIFGVVLGEPQQVFAKSATICLECIGVG